MNFAIVVFYDDDDDMKLHNLCIILCHVQFCRFTICVFHFNRNTVIIIAVGHNIDFERLFQIVSIWPKKKN